ncbi:MAG: hypothetical protein ACP5MD_11585, partial [Verrucomicrobiia bacterium]
KAAQRWDFDYRGHEVAQSAGQPIAVRVPRLRGIEKLSVIGPARRGHNIARCANDSCGHYRPRSFSASAAPTLVAS